MVVADIDFPCGRYGFLLWPISSCCGRYGLWLIWSHPSISIAHPLQSDRRRITESLQITTHIIRNCRRDGKVKSSVPDGMQMLVVLCHLKISWQLVGSTPVVQQWKMLDLQILDLSVARHSLHDSRLATTRGPR